MHDILVLGGGPAACVSALHLSQLGYSTVLLVQPRREPFVEGLSARVVEGLRNAGCRRTVGYLGEPVPRTAIWNGARSTANQEYVVNRAHFDAALLEDVRASDVSVIEGKVTRVQLLANGRRVQILAADGHARDLQGRFVVEARGRRAPRNRGLALRGQRTVALSRRYLSCSRRPPGTSVASFRSGWAWFADTAPEQGVLQLMIGVERAGSIRSRDLPVLFDRLVEQIGEAKEWLGKKPAPAEEVRVRDATAYLHRAPIEDRIIRVGDAVYGIDPLSGHGIFEAVGGAMAAAPVVNTLLRRPENGEIAAGYYADRARQAFLQHARVGRDFYRSERRWAESPFWALRSGWPDDEPAHGGLKGRHPRIRRQPVIEDGFIERREVVVTEEHPRGVRFIGGVPLVAVIDRVDGAKPFLGVERTARDLGVPVNNLVAAIDWLSVQKVLEVDGDAVNVSAARLRENGKDP